MWRPEANLRPYSLASTLCCGVFRLGISPIRGSPIRPSWLTGEFWESSCLYFSSAGIQACVSAPSSHMGPEVKCKSSFVRGRHLGSCAVSSSCLVFKHRRPVPPRLSGHHAESLLRPLGRCRTEPLTPTLWETSFLPIQCSSCLLWTTEELRTARQLFPRVHSLLKDNGIHTQSPPPAMLRNPGISPSSHDTNTPAGFKMVGIMRID